MLPLVLFREESQLIINHLIALDDESKRLRFGYRTTDDRIRDYVTKSFDHKNNVWYGYMVDGQCIGAIHVCIDDAVCELGISIDASHRGQGLARSLFDRAIVYAKAQEVTTLTMQCLSENSAIQHIARSSGMHVVTIGPGEKQASINIDPGFQILSAMHNLSADYMAIIDNNIRTQTFLLKSLNLFNHKESQS